MTLLGKLFIVFGFLIIFTEGFIERKSRSGKLSSNRIEKSVQEPESKVDTKPTCSLCAQRNLNLDRCPNEIVKAEPLGASEESSEMDQPFVKPKRKGLLDLMTGILRTVHSSSHAELQRAREKEAVAKMLEIMRSSLAESDPDYKI